MLEGDFDSIVAMDPSAGLRPELLQAELQRPWARCWVARDPAGDPLAYLTAWHVTDELLVMNLATRSDRCRRGLGRAMMSTALQYARGHAISRVFLEVRRSNSAAIGLYRSIGFFAVGVRRRYYGDGEDAVEMVLDLEPTTGAVVRHADHVTLDP
jgi:[ribosomal protein S18]-alanine N-acetyltransferase